MFQILFLEEVKEETLEKPKIIEEKKTEIQQLPSFMCMNCQEIFCTTKDLAKHQKKAHSSPFVCNFCNREFRSLFLLRQHNTLCKDNESSECKLNLSSLKL